MLRTFTIENCRIVEDKGRDDTSIVDRLRSAHWIDAQNATDEEREALSRFLNTALPDDEDFEDIESSARYFVDDDGIHVHSLFLSQREGRYTTQTVGFILQKQRLITLHDENLVDFRLFRMRARAGRVETTSPESLLVTLFDQKAENLADTVEDLHMDLEQVSHSVLEGTAANREEDIDALANLEDTNGKIRLCLLDTQRSVSFVLRNMLASSAARELAREILSDVDTLMSHIAFLFDKINFLMDTTVSFINLEQSKIIKIFSIAAVVFLPPTMVASIYGMNFDLMPELHWSFGYPFALLVMLGSGLAPYLYFKYRKWL